MTTATEGQPSWSVAATVRADPSLCDLFARHYLARGARRVFLFHDDPAMACEVRRDGVTNTVCDEHWWRRGRPQALEERQVHNATKARAWCKTDWILHCDVDELIWSESQVSEVLATVPEDVAGVVIPTAEAVYASPPTPQAIFATPFFKFFHDETGRPRAYREVSRRAYGDLWPASKYGFWGHILGKSFIRTAAPIGKMPLHYKNKAEIGGFRMQHRASGLVLRHYDTLSPDLWKDKHLRRIQGKVSVPMAGRFRALQQEMIFQAALRNGEAGLERIYLRMATLPPETLTECIVHGFVRVIRPEPHLLAGTSAQEG